MVYAKPNASSGAMKRSASALHEGPPGWDVAPPMMTSTPAPSFRLPYAHYAMIYLDNEGKIKVDESSSIQEQRTTLFTPEVRQNFLEILGERVGFQQSNSSGRRTMNASPRRVRRRRNAPGASTTDNRHDDGSDSDEYSGNGATDMIPIRVGDTQKVMSYYEGALKHFQQLNCRMVAKAFIKFIEPRKQVRHPYNGGKPPAGSAPGATGDPEKTKPEWWPPGVMHKEPDHLRKEYRIELLLHIIRKLGSFGITADKLKDVAGDTKRSLKDPAHVDIIYEILRVRKMEERFERGEVDSNMVVFVQNRGPSPKGDGDEEEDSNDLVDIEAHEPIEGGLMTPTSSVEQISAPLTTPIDTMPMPRSLPGSFSIPDPLSFDSKPISFDSSRPDRPYYATPPHYTDSFSQPMLSTPVSAEMISPHEVSVFDYPPTSFPTSSPDQPRHTTGPYDTWAPPSFRQDIFSPVGYSAPTTQGMPSMPYHLPMASPAQLHDMSSHPSPLDSMGQRALPFRTGSLGHPHGLPLSHA